MNVRWYNKDVGGVGAAHVQQLNLIWPTRRSVGRFGTPLEAAEPSDARTSRHLLVLGGFCVAWIGRLFVWPMWAKGWAW